MAGLIDVIGLSKAPIEKDNTSISSSINEGVKAGIGLATAKEQIESSKMKVAEQKQELLTKQATAMMNRTKAAMFAQSPAAFESIMNANKNYANSLNIPYNDEALRAAYKDPDLRLAAQKEINTVLQGGVSKNPQAIVDFFGSDSPAIFEHLQNTSYANAQVKNKESFELEKQGRQLYSQEKIAQMNVDKVLAKEDQKEDKAIAKEDRKELKQLDDDMFKIDSTIADIMKAKDKLSSYSKNSYAGTGPIATGFGLKSYVDEDTEGLEASFNKLSLKSMVDMFAGMSKAIDTGAERKAFESTQAGIKLDDKTNQDILNNYLNAAIKMKEKYKVGKEKLIAKISKTSPISSATTQASSDGLTPDLQAKLDKVLSQLPPEKHAAATKQFLQKVQTVTAKGQ